jgi:hypothetical protein
MKPGRKTLPQCTANVADGSKARITAPQHCCPLQPQSADISAMDSQGQAFETRGPARLAAEADNAARVNG